MCTWGCQKKKTNYNDLCFKITAENRYITSFNKPVQFNLAIVIPIAEVNDLFVIYVVDIIRTIAPVGLNKRFFRNAGLYQFLNWFCFSLMLGIIYGR